MAGGQLQVLGALDLAKTRWYHFTATVIAGMGFFTDAYDLFCISLVTKLLGRIYSFDPNRSGRSRPTCPLPSPAWPSVVPSLASSSSGGSATSSAARRCMA
ncbi:unnamed protein product, partial [Musa hybrid cultivar]